MIDERNTKGGFASFVAIVLSLLITFALMVIYLRNFVPRGAKGGPQGTALEAAKNQAKAFEEQQKKRLEQMEEVSH